MAPYPCHMAPNPNHILTNPPHHLAPPCAYKYPPILHASSHSFHHNEVLPKLLLGQILGEPWRGLGIPNRGGDAPFKPSYGGLKGSSNRPPLKGLPSFNKSASRKASRRVQGQPSWHGGREFLLVLERLLKEGGLLVLASTWRGEEEFFFGFNWRKTISSSFLARTK